MSPGSRPRPAEEAGAAARGRRIGPFWIEEPPWFVVLAALLFVAGLVAFLVAVGFDRP